MDALAIDLDARSAANNLSWVDELVEPGVVDGGERARVRSLLLENLLVRSLRWLRENPSLKAFRLLSWCLEGELVLVNMISFKRVKSAYAKVLQILGSPRMQEWEIIGATCNHLQFMEIY